MELLEEWVLVVVTAKRGLVDPRVVAPESLNIKLLLTALVEIGMLSVSFNFVLFLLNSISN
ncbi:MAG: hypothetical protein KGZ39_02540 [Simkania sp.]|nr:hypothetical protein [Simkania sp.]